MTRSSGASLVLDRLYIGGEDDTTSSALAALNITHVVNCTANLPFHPLPASLPRQSRKRRGQWWTAANSVFEWQMWSPQ